MLKPSASEDFLQYIIQLSYHIYSAEYTENLNFMMGMDRVNGIHFTLHESTTVKDLGKFVEFQSEASKYKNKSFRLYIHPNISLPVFIMPNVWSRVEVKPWQEEDECCLPKDEELLCLDGLKNPYL